MFIAEFYNVVAYTNVKSIDFEGKIRGKENDLVDTDSFNPDAFPYSFSSTLDIGNYEVKGPNRFVEWKDGISPYEITPKITKASDEAAKVRKEHIKNSMKHG